jgi:rhodanese-related sulfurtransferase
MAGFEHEAIYTQLARIGKALANPARLLLLDLLDQRELTVEQLAEESGIALKNTSAQLKELRAANLVAGRKEGTRVYYRLADARVTAFLGAFEDFAEGRLADLRGALAEEFGDLLDLDAVTPEELEERLRDGRSLVIDVRSAEDYAAGHLPGAVSIPLDRLREEIDRIPRDAEIIAYCRGPYCLASSRSVRLLREHGRRARTLGGGYLRYRRQAGV